MRERDQNIIIRIIKIVGGIALSAFLFVITLGKVKPGNKA